MTVRATIATRTEVPKDQTDTVFRTAVKDDDGTAVDVSGMTIQVKFQAPDGTISTETAAFSTRTASDGDGTDGEIEFVDTGGDYTNAAGTWFYWGVVADGSSGPFQGTLIQYTVGVQGR